ncbi:MAG: preprotein translocase subunit SecG [Chlamydiae bacterium GWC2_50_10]|nr:MAG: preprotein translocase subunit SecG [Chlamydiae bacterium GWA2_50_15]OGN53542.1 MAG: preprotein translocase subunit SecG [Chlamydiae bacterium GWC2_50_10]OGN54363.1 MAG: preprotein translocase subunit SecG [Chlamydiae bacterium GWF2_49_8]OGN58124.1 MAG: preprotein translocase subunit SecG [Chlamydiae bacterium RIFCSPHIGHO2_02_FULL_49_29]OGN64533.1 MAG: preprotein translocase subunit SecG [Chlamydiae bacterium RIFCSPHIGHO2_12_FULL_49_32]OGN71670.1 MAG: preprotein translocase subunit Sec
MHFLFYLSIFLFLFICFITCFIVLIQESKSLGLGASFGGDAGESLFGTSTAEVLKKITAYLALIFVIACVFLSLWTSALGRRQVKAGTAIEESAP